jgi:trehalose/maltose hydrolase-like predicted phosphorylase
MGPDEDHWNITNNAFTNVIAAMNLNFGEFAGCVCKSVLNVKEKDYEHFSKIARKIKLIYDKKYDYFPQFEGYKIGTSIKQADAVLLSYPLQYKMKMETKRKNLLIYENVTRENGPAMTYCIF